MFCYFSFLCVICVISRRFAIEICVCVFDFTGLLIKLTTTTVVLKLNEGIIIDCF